VTISTEAQADLRLKRPNRWPSGRRYRSRYLRAFQLDQRIGSILLAVVISLAINGAAFWLLYTATPIPLPRPEPELVIVMLGEPDPDPEALTDLSPPVPAETEEVAAQASTAPLAQVIAPPRPPAPTPPSTASVSPTAVPAPAVPPAAPPPAAPAPVYAPVPAATDQVLGVTLPPPTPAATAQDLTDLPAETGEVLAAEVASPEPTPQPVAGARAPQTEPPAPTAVVAETSPVPEPVDARVSPALPEDAAEQLARVLAAPRPDLPLPTLPPRSAAEPLRALPPQLRRDPQRSALPEPEAPRVEPEIAALPAVPLTPETSPAPIERAPPPELRVEPKSPEAPVRAEPPPRRTKIARSEPSASALEPQADVALAPVTPVTPRVAVPEARRPEVDALPPQTPRVELALPVRPPAVTPPVALPPPRAATPARVRPAPLAALPREAPRLAAPAPGVSSALPPEIEAVREMPVTPGAAPALERDALQVRPSAPARPDRALLAGADASATPEAAASAPIAGNAADFGLTDARPGAPEGADWSDRIRAAAQDQVAAESAARRASRAPWQRDEAWFAEDPPARMEQLLRDDPNLAKIMVDFLLGALVSGAAQTPRTIYKVGPDPGVLIQLWLDRHHGDLQLACRRDAAAMPEAALRVLCPGERIEALEFDAARPPGE
jgi:hypothetical protein